MKNERKIKSVVISAMVLFALLAVFTTSASASGGTTETGSPDPSASLSAFYSTKIYGDYVAAGVGMRGTGSGTITIGGIPGGSTVVKAFLYWAIIANSEGTNFKNGVFDGSSITGTLIGTDDDPCWAPTTTYAYRADVTSLVSGNGAYTLSGFATGPSTLNEGASLVVVYSNPLSACRDIVIYDGADTIDSAVSSVSTVMTGFTASAAPSAKTTYIVADGQDRFSDDTIFNTVTLASDTPTTSASFEGSDGPLWDTDTYDVSVYVSAGDTSCTVKLQGGADCLVHTAQVFSVTTQHPLWEEINAELDSLKGNVSAATMPSIILRRLVDKLEYAKALKDNAKIECKAGNFDGATKKLGVAKSQVKSFASMVRITRRISPADKASFLADSTEIIVKIQALIEYVETEHKC